MLWITWFGIVFSYYGIFMWLPSLIYQQGFTIIKSFEYLFIMTLAQFPGYISAAYLVDKIGRRYTLSLYLLCSGISSYFFGHATSETMLLASGICMSFFNLGAWGVIYTYTPDCIQPNPRSRFRLGSRCRSHWRHHSTYFSGCAPIPSNAHGLHILSLRLRLCNHCACSVEHGNGK